MSFTQCLETKRFTTATVISQYTHMHSTRLAYIYVSFGQRTNDAGTLLVRKAEKQNKNRKKLKHSRCAAMD